jgi:hypothetical protein
MSPRTPTRSHVSDYSRENDMTTESLAGLHDQITGCTYMAVTFADGGQFCNKCGWAFSPAVIDAAHLTRQREWSEITFGPGARTLGVLNHIRSELDEIEADPTDLEEWVDVVILAFDGAWRAGWEPQEIIDAIVAKQSKNEARTWPDWRTMSQDQAIEHDRSTDE